MWSGQCCWSCQGQMTLECHSGMENRMQLDNSSLVKVCLSFLLYISLPIWRSSVAWCEYDQQELDVREELTSTTGCRGRDLNRRHFSPWGSTLPLSYPATQVGVVLENRGYYDQQHIYVCRSRSRWAWFGGGKQFRFIDSPCFINSLASASFNFCVFAYACVFINWQ